MKKKSNVAVVLFLSLFSMGCTSETVEETGATEQIITSGIEDVVGVNAVSGGTVKTKWTLGRKSKNCRGFGICKLKEVGVEIKFKFDAPQPLEQAFTSKFEQVSPVQFQLLLDQANADYIQSEYGGAFFLLEESFVFTPQESAQLNLIQGFTIAPGLYNLQFNPVTTLYEVTFDHQP